MHKWLNNISRDLQTVFSGRGTRTTKLRMRMLRSLKSSSEGFHVTAMAIPNFPAMQTYN